MDEKIQIVDKEDNPIGFATREEAWKKGLVHEFVRIIIFDQDGRVLLQRRSPAKKKYANMWTDAATGHVDYKETYETAAPRELKEEIGISTDLQYLGKFYIEDQSEQKITKAFHGVFKGVVDKDVQLKVEPSEVSEVKWFETEKLKKMIIEDPEQFTPGVKQVVKRYL